MKANVGYGDRVARVVLGVVLLSLLYFLEGDARWFGLIGLVPLLTAAVGSCPLYSLFGINTCGTRGGGRGRLAS